MKFRRLAVFLASALLALPLAAQVGPSRWGSVKAFPFGAVNRATLDNHIEIPIFTRSTGSGVQVGLRLVYDSQFWSAAGTSGPWSPTANFGWRLAQPFGTLNHTQTIGSPYCGYYNNTTGSYDEWWNLVTDSWTFVEPDGSIPTADYATSEYLVLGGGSRQRGDTYDCSPVYGTGSVQIPDGKGYTIEVFNVNQSSAYAEAFNSRGDEVDGLLKDPNGNQVTTSTSGGTTSYYDPLSAANSGAAALTQTGSGTPSSPYYYTYTGSNGNSVQVEEQFESLSVTTSFSCGTGHAQWSGTATVPSELDLPDGSKYTFGYDGDARLTSVTLPTGATVNYSYVIDCNSSYITDTGNDNFTRWDSINGSSHGWQWTRSQQGGGAVQTVETDPYGNDGVYSFAAPYWPGESGALTAVALYSGSHTSGAELESAAITNTLSSNYLSQQVTDITDYGSPTRYMETVLAPNAWGLPLYEYTYDWSSSCFTCGTFLRNVTTSYTALLGGVAAVPAETTVSPNTGSGGQISQTNFSYDSNGNLLTADEYVNSTTYLSKTWTYNTNGTVATATDTNNGKTTYTYGTGSCGGHFPTSVASPVTAVTTSATWNCVGGVELSSTDASGQTTTTTFNDPNGIWRPSSVTTPDNSVTDLAYTPNSVERAMTFNGGNSADEVLTTLDGLGQPILVQRYQGPVTGQYDSVETEYDAMGRVVGVSQPFSANAGSTTGATDFTTTTYDALSRPLTVTDAGSGTLTYSYNDNDVYSAVGPAPTGENPKRKQEQFDALGRLQSVCEITGGTSSWPSASCSQTSAATGYLTTYTRNALGAITGVTQNAQSSTTETRSFSYDWLGRMTAETAPESGTTDFTFDTDATCGTSDGDLVKRVDADGTVTCYAYDALHRVTEVSYPTLGTGVAATPNKYLVYDAATVDSTTMANVVGKLAEAYTANSATPTTHITDLGFSYPNPTSNEEDVYQSSPSSGGWYVTTLQHYPNGSPSTLTLPVGVPAITYGLDHEGRPNAVTTNGSPATLVSSSGTTYSADGLTALALGSGDSDAYTYDTATGRMTQYQFTVGGQTDTGALTWNDNGSLASVQITDNITGTSDSQTCDFTHL